MNPKFFFLNLIVDFISSCTCLLFPSKIWTLTVSMMLVFSFFFQLLRTKHKNRKVMHSFAKNKPAIQNLYTKLVLSNYEIWSHIHTYNSPKNWTHKQTPRVRVRYEKNRERRTKKKFLVFVCLIAKRKQYNVKLEVNSTEIACLFF